MSAYMDNLPFGTPFSMQGLTDTSPLSKPVRNHLQAVYTNVLTMCFAAAAGAWLMPMNLGFLSLIGIIGSYMYIASTRNDPSKDATRYAVLHGIGFIQGMSLGPMIYAFIEFDPSIITTALLGTATIFGCFTISAMYNTKREYLYMAGTLGSALNMLFFMGLFNMFIGSEWLLLGQLYGGLVVFSFFVAYDTQMIIERAKLGDMDNIMHAIDLFADVVAIFIRLAIILARNSENNDRRRRENNSRRR
eukprot:Clim_evm11s84 gene=Clim_evmTU11s84